MFKMLIDTCVWLDLAKDPKQTPALGVVEELVRRRMLALIVPRVMLDEFRRNRERVAKESAKSLSAHFRIVKDAIGKSGGNSRRVRALLAHLDEVDHRLPLTGGVATDVLDRIEALLSAAPVLEAPDSVMCRASRRALDGRAPFHRGRNSIGDAILFETYSGLIHDRSEAGVRFAFVTHNKSDFSADHDDQRLPHPDLRGSFSRIKSRYFINLPEALRCIDPTLVSDVLVENSWAQEPRRLPELLEAEELLFNQVWYDRKQVLISAIEKGHIRIVDELSTPLSPEREIRRDIWAGMLRAMRKVERRYGKKNLGPWTNFEWGMINGKLSALRWVLGDDWDMLDT